MDLLCVYMCPCALVSAVPPAPYQQCQRQCPRVTFRRHRCSRARNKLASTPAPQCKVHTVVCLLHRVLLCDGSLTEKHVLFKQIDGTLVAARMSRPPCAAKCRRSPLRAALHDRDRFVRRCVRCVYSVATYGTLPFLQ